VNSDGTVPSTIDAESYFGVPSKQTGKDTYYDAELQHEFFDNLKLVVRGSYQETDFDYQISQSGYNYAGGRGFGPGDTEAYVYYSLGYRDTEVQYGDIQLVGAFDAFGQKHDWVVGATNQQTKFASFFAFGGVLGIVDINDIGAATFIEPDFNLTLNPFRDVEDELVSVYGETNLRPTDRLTIVAGVRYDEYEQTNLSTNVTTPTDDTTFRIGGTYELTDGLNGYLSYAESFVPQGGTTRSGNPVDPETAVNYEAGLKGNLLDGRIGLTAAVFALTRQNVATADPNNVPGNPPFVIATGEQEHNGFEVSANFAVTPALKVELGYGYVDAEVTGVISPGTGEDVGDPVALVPQQTFSAFGTYTVQDGSLSGLRIGLGARGISERPAPRFNLEYDGYTIVDALVAYPISETLDVQLNVHNLLDEEYRETPGFSTGTTAGGHRFGNPRAFYVTARARF
jgi:iron complex outermembrane receptor protein